MKGGFRDAPLSARDRAMLLYVEKLARTPWLLEEGDIAALRGAGWEDAGILHIVLGSSIFNYLNRVADGTGIQLEYPASLPGFALPEEPPAPGHPPRDEDPRQAPRQPPAPAAGRPAQEAWIDLPADQPRPRAGEPRNLFWVMGANPEARDLARAWRAYHLKAARPLDARRRLRVALYVAALDGAGYSLHWHRRALAGLREDPRLVDALAAGRVPEGLDGLDRLLLAHAERLTRRPWTAREEHVEALRQAGLDDRAILQLTTLVSYLSFENRVALGLGVALEQS